MFIPGHPTLYCINCIEIPKPAPVRKEDMHESQIAPKTPVDLHAGDTLDHGRNKRQTKRNDRGKKDAMLYSDISESETDSSPKMIRLTTLLSNNSSAKRRADNRK